jgi:hypothetical protein
MSDWLFQQPAKGGPYMSGVGPMDKPALTVGHCAEEAP